MNYVVLDMEWNQPLSYESQVFRMVGDKLLFEVIQFGAIKLNDKLEIVDSISIPVRPTHYVRIHPRIKRMTKLDAEAFENAPYFSEAVEQFASWCGEDYVLLTWGCDDVSVLYQNMEFFNCDTKLSLLYDIQVLYSKVFNLGKERKGLSAAMEQLGVEAEEDRGFHNALHDAYYTARVFQKLPQPSDVLEYVETPKKLVHAARKRTKKRNEKHFDSLEAALNSTDACCAPCPICNQATTQDGRFIRQAGDKYVGLLKCSNHDAIFAQLLLTAQPNGVFMSVTTSAANKLKVAYIHTKQLQPEPLDDPMEALKQCTRTNMPFDD